MVDIVPTSGYKNPAPTEARTSRMGRVNPEGAPFKAGSDVKERWVLAMLKQYKMFHYWMFLDGVTIDFKDSYICYKTSPGSNLKQGFLDLS
jgi:hypothetical protein